MSLSRVRTFAIGAASVAVAGGAALWLLLPGDGSGLVPYVGGWGTMAAIGIAAGTAVAAGYGRPAPAFLAPLVAGMLLRLVAVTVGALAAAGGGDLVPFLLGAAAGFAPVQAFEVVYFWRAARGSRRGTAVAAG